MTDAPTGCFVTAKRRAWPSPIAAADWASHGAARGDGMKKRHCHSAYAFGAAARQSARGVPRGDERIRFARSKRTFQIEPTTPTVDAAGSSAIKRRKLAACN